MNFAFLETSAAGGSMWTSIIMMALIILVFWFFIIRPQRKKDKETAKMRSELQVGDEIVTIGGIIGIIVSIINGINRIFFILLSLFNVKLPVTKLRGMDQPGCRRFTDIYTPIMDFDGRVKILKRKELYL